jgi:hypothetical protein
MKKMNKLAASVAFLLTVIGSVSAQDIQFTVKATIPEGWVFNYPIAEVAPGGTIIARYTFDQNAVGTPYNFFGLIGVLYPVKEFSVEVEGVGSLLQTVTSVYITIFPGVDEYDVRVSGYDIFGNFTIWSIELQGNGGATPLLQSGELPLIPLDLSRAGIKYVLSSSFTGASRDVASYWVSGIIDSFTLGRGEDVTPPAVTVSATPKTLSPPNGKMVTVTVSGTITDASSGVNASTATYAVTDEYGSVQPSGKVTLGSNGSYSFTIQLQASRNGNDQDGRHYTIKVNAQDNAGNSGSAYAGVTVPHDQGN